MMLSYVRHERLNREGKEQGGEGVSLESSSSDGNWGCGAVRGEEGGCGRRVEVPDEPGEVVREPQEGEYAGEEEVVLRWEGTL